MSDLRLGFVSELISSGEESRLNFSGFLCVFGSSIEFIGMGSPKNFAKAE